MPIANSTSREITAKIVYFGPGLSGKTTNVEQVHARVDPSTRGRLLSLNTDEERTLFFDLLPVTAGKIGGFQLRFQLYTAPGQVYYNASRRVVLHGADGLVFVADSHPGRLEANIESLQSLYDNCRALGITVGNEEPTHVPLVLSYNKRDLPGALPVSVLEDNLNYDQVPAFQAVAKDGIGVFEALGEAMRLTERNIRRQFRL